jgi:hypothetical protein
MGGEQHQHAADDLDAVGDQHHLALGHRVRERTDQRRESDVGDHEAHLERGGHPRRFLQFTEQRDRGDQQRVVGERREELRRHDGVEPALHRPPITDRDAPRRVDTDGKRRRACV